jgi:hypothetical protein
MSIRERYLSPYQDDGEKLYSRKPLVANPPFRVYMQPFMEYYWWVNDVCFDNMNAWVECSTKEKAMAAQDKKLLEQGFVLLTQEQFDRLRVLV